MEEEPPRTQEIIDFVRQKPNVTAWKKAFSADGLFTLEHMDALAWYINRRETHRENTGAPLGVTLLRLATMIVDRFGLFPDIWGRQPRSDTSVLDLWTMANPSRRIKPHVYFLVHVLDPSCFSPSLYTSWGLSIGNRLDHWKIPRCSAINVEIFEKYGVPIPGTNVCRYPSLSDPNCNPRIVITRHAGTIALNHLDMMAHITVGGGWTDLMFLLADAVEMLSDEEILTIPAGQHYSLFSLFMTLSLMDSTAKSSAQYNDMARRYRGVEFTMVPEYAKRWARYGRTGTAHDPETAIFKMLTISSMLSHESREKLIQYLRSIESWDVSEEYPTEAPPIRRIVQELCPVGTMTKAAM